MYFKNLQVLVCESLLFTHAVFHHHEAALVAFEALAFKISRCVDTSALTTQVRRDAALIDVCKKGIWQNSDEKKLLFDTGKKSSGELPLLNISFQLQPSD